MFEFLPLLAGRRKTTPPLLDWFPRVFKQPLPKTMKQLPGTIVLNEMAPVFGWSLSRLVLASQLEVVAPAGERFFSDTVWLATSARAIHLGNLRRSVVFGNGCAP